MKLRRNALRLGVVALAVWLIACLVLYRAGEAFLEHRRLRAEVARMEQEYAAQLEALGQVLIEGERVKNNEAVQEQILIDRYGYTRPDETPIVIVDETAAND